MLRLRNKVNLNNLILFRVFRNGKRNAYKILVGRLGGKLPRGDLHRCKENSKKQSVSMWAECNDVSLAKWQ